MSDPNLSVEIRPWSDGTNCIVIVKDGINDERSPVLHTTEQAVQLAVALLLKADRLLDLEAERNALLFTEARLLDMEQARDA